MTHLDSILKSRDITLSTKVRLVRAVVFPVVMYGCKSWTIKKAEHRRIDAFWTVLLEKTLESPLNCKEIHPVHPKGDQSWVFIGRTVVEVETPVLWPPDAKSWLIWKDPDAGKDWGLEEKGMTEDEMFGWHHQLKAHGCRWTLGVGDGQGGRRALVHGVAKCWTRLSHWTEHFKWITCLCNLIFIMTEMVTILFPFCKWGNRLKEVVTRLVSVRLVSVWMQTVFSKTCDNRTFLSVLKSASITAPAPNMQIKNILNKTLSK